jgi:hypothetical protein
VRRAAAFGLLFAAMGCATPVAYLASPADYAAYRQTRVAPTLEARLKAADEYLTRFPDGSFQPYVRPWFERAELVFYKAKQGSLAGLEDYLRTLPRGPHGDEAAGRRSALKATRENREAELAVASSLTAKLDRASAERRAVRLSLATWIGRFLDAEVWKAPLSQARAELIIPWSLELPSPSCAPLEAPQRADLPAGAVRRCAKILELPYAVTVDGASDERQATVEITVLQDASGRPLQTSIGGPELFLRLEETFTVQAAAPGDPERRIAAISRAADLVRSAFGQAVSRDPACKLPAALPVFVALGCHGVRITARAAVEPGDDDLILVGPDLALPIPP